MMARSAAGYTLVELVVVMLLLGIIAIACESGISFGGQVWKRTDQNARATFQIVAGQAVLRTLLAHSLPRMRGAYITFEGEPTAISFDAIPPLAFESGGTAHAHLWLNRSHNGTELVLEMQSIARPAYKQRAILVSDAGLLRFSYLDASDGSQTWLSHWRDRSRLPDAIRIAAVDYKKWPSLVVRPMIVQSINCMPNPEDLTCRKI